MTRHTQTVRQYVATLDKRLNSACDVANDAIRRLDEKDRQIEKLQRDVKALTDRSDE